MPTPVREDVPSTPPTCSFLQSTGTTTPLAWWSAPRRPAGLLVQRVRRALGGRCEGEGARRPAGEAGWPAAS